ncbi:hypothetical protein C2I36_01255 [Rhodobacteraceae bacterium WD3A24]|nr:hypothetical protein C2I36_01255 [Rhodobacteraceae bacterium WD3A24]
MKKILLASTALVMTTGIAAADNPNVELSGDAEMGVMFDDSMANEWSFTSEATVGFTLSGETDGGLQFGASFDADEAVGAAGGTDGSVFISGAFGRLSMGDVDSAADAAVGDISGVGLTGLEDTMAYLSNDTLPAALYEYSSGGFSVYLGADQISSSDDEWSIGAAYSAGNYSFAAGFEKDTSTTATPTGPDDEHFALSGSGTFGAVTLTAAAGFSNDNTQGGVSLDYVTGPTTVTGYYFHDFAEDANYGLGAEYDLGGGAALVGGIAHYEATDNTLADFGISMSF